MLVSILYINSARKFYLKTSNPKIFHFPPNFVLKSTALATYILKGTCSEMMGIIGGLKVIADDNARLRIAGGPFLFFDKM